MEKFETAIKIGFKIFAGIAAGYFVYKATYNKTSELIQDGTPFTGVMVGVGQGLVMTAVGMFVYDIIA